MTIAWGSENVGGATCWSGGVSPGTFRGALTSMRALDVELGASEIAELAKRSP